MNTNLSRQVFSNKRAVRRRVHLHLHLAGNRPGVKARHETVRVKLAQRKVEQKMPSMRMRETSAHNRQKNTSHNPLLYNAKERKVGSGTVVLVIGISSNSHSSQLITSRWSFHNGRVLSLAWTKDGKHCASGSLDTHVYIWSVDKPMKNIAIKNAGAGSINTVFWLGDSRLASAGADGCVRVWDITFHA